MTLFCFKIETSISNHQFSDRFNAIIARWRGGIEQGILFDDLSVEVERIQVF